MGAVAALQEDPPPPRPGLGTVTPPPRALPAGDVCQLHRAGPQGPRCAFNWRYPTRLTRTEPVLLNQTYQLPENQPS